MGKRKAKSKTTSRTKSEPIRIGLIGIGRAGWKMHRKELSSRTDKFQIVAACDPIKKRRDMLADEVGCTTYRTFEEVLSDERVELIDIASPSPHHVAQAMEALRSGFDVFLEKPIALTFEEAKALRASKRRKNNLYIRHNRRFEPAFQHIREIIDDGVLGEVFEIKLRRMNYSRRDDWQTLIDCGGGQLLNWGPHIIDHGLRLLDSKRVDLWSDLKRIAALGDAEDHLKIVMKGANGRIVDLEISGGSAITEPLYIVSGTKGGLSCDGKEIFLRYLDPKKKLPRCRAKKSTPSLGPIAGKEGLSWIEKTIDIQPKLQVAPPSIWDYLFDAIRHGSDFPITLDEAMDVMSVVDQVKKGTEFEPRRGKNAGGR